MSVHDAQDFCYSNRGQLKCYFCNSSHVIFGHYREKPRTPVIANYRCLECMRLLNSRSLAMHNGWTVDKKEGAL